MLTSLDVSDNSLGRDAAKSLDNAFRKNPEECLTSPGFRGQRFKAGGREISGPLPEDRVQLTALDASRNRFGVAAGVAFAGAIKKNSALCHLNLEKNGLGTKGGKSIAVAVQDNHALVSLDLSDNGFGPDVLRAFSRSLAQAGHADLPGPVGPDREQFNDDHVFRRRRRNVRRHARVDGPRE